MTGLTLDEKLVRIGRMTGSSFAGLLGRSPYQPPSKAWAAQMGLVETVGSVPMAMGNIYEEAIRQAAKYKLERGLVPHQLDAKRYARVDKPSSTYHASFGDWLVVHPDGEFPDARQILQCKRHDPRAMRSYGMPGERGEADNDIVPVHELIQCQIELECVASNKPRQARPEWRVCWLAVECGEAEGPRLYRIVKNASLTLALLEAGETFWKAHMQGKGVEPDDSAWAAWMEKPAPEPGDTRAPRIKFTAEDLIAAPPVEIGGKP